jgi:two-component system response regulator HydG
MKKVAAKILIIDDDPDVLIAARVVLRQRFENVDTESNPQRISALLRKTKYDVILLDMNFSAGRTSGNEGLFWLKEILGISANQKVVLITAYGDIQIAVEAMKIGAADFIVKPWQNEQLEASVNAALTSNRSKNNFVTRNSGGVQSVREEIVGSSPAMILLVNTARKVAVTDANVLLLGENGTGKELIAKIIHHESNRSSQPFVKVDAGSIAPSLFESELFGHKKGAFTDAKEDRVGRIELANGGTLFLDEVGNLNIDLQSKLLSVLQNREVIPLGGSKPRPIDIRLISATNVKIHQAVDEGNFRQDLLFRINTVEITVPPLRDRLEDIPALANYFLELYGAKYRKQRTISQDALKQLREHPWPGNIRELQHAIERAVIMSDHDQLSPTDFLLAKSSESHRQRESLNLDEMEKKTIIAAIQKYQGNMSKVAKELGVGRTTLYRKLTRYGLAK